ncbi:MAG TPA: hypothetical protein VEH29_10275, partial [Acidimicrobiales bacterium]|nr:hypothetical protein [Acidimicrobiales bacterium]
MTRRFRIAALAVSTVVVLGLTGGIVAITSGKANGKRVGHCTPGEAAAACTSSSTSAGASSTVTSSTLERSRHRA